MTVLKILVWSKIKNYKKILIMEDDAIFHKSIISEFNKKIKNEKRKQTYECILA